MKSSSLHIDKLESPLFLLVCIFYSAKSKQYLDYLSLFFKSCMKIDIIIYNIDDYDNHEQAFSLIPNDLETEITNTGSKYQTAIIYIENPIFMLHNKHKEFSWFKSLDFIKTNFILMLYKESVVIRCMSFRYMAIKDNIIVEKREDIKLNNNFIVIDNISIENLQHYFLGVDQCMDLFGIIVHRGFFDDEDNLNYSYFYSNIPIYKSHNFIHTISNGYNLSDILTINMNSLNNILTNSLMNLITDEKRDRLLEYFNV